MKDLIYYISKENHNEESLKKILNKHPEIKFISLIGVDLSGHETDTKIPTNLFLEDLDSFLKGSTQTDGSSVVLPKIATLNNAKIDLVPDPDVNWFVDYNYELLHEETSKPVGTLRVPCFLYHEDKAVDSRSILKNSITSVKENLLNMINNNPSQIEKLGYKLEDIEDVTMLAATELEFWVKTPDEEAHLEELSTSQVLKEQYWKKTVGIVRTSLEECLLLMEKYGLEPEMGHKEVGGVKAAINHKGRHDHIMEQLEIDWKYNEAVQAADNVMFIRSLIKEVFRKNGLEVTFLAKPIENVAGNGMHVHQSIILKLKNGKKINLYAPAGKHFMSIFGYGALMGILNNYEVVSPFVTSSYNGLKRLKPGYEAPVCTVTSLGNSVDVPSRNRTVLLGLIRDLNNPMATRFELRAPNPHSNTYLTLASLNMATLDGIDYAVSNDRTEDDLLNELSKDSGEFFGYLEKERMYRSEKNIFDDFTQEALDKYFGKAPRTVYECLLPLKEHKEKRKILSRDNIISDLIIESYAYGRLSKWLTEVKNRIVPNYVEDIRKMVPLHDSTNSTVYDENKWEKIINAKKDLIQTTNSSTSLFDKIRKTVDDKDFRAISKLQIEMDEKVEELKKMYEEYKLNIL